MTTEDLEDLIQRVRRWPKERQEDAAEILLEMERQDGSGYRLTDAQAEEVVRIRRDIREGRGGSIGKRRRYAGSPVDAAATSNNVPGGSKRDLHRSHLRE